MEIKSAADVYHNLDYAYAQNGQSSRGYEVSSVNSGNPAKSAAAIYEKGGQTEFYTYSAASVQAAAADSAVISKMRVYLNDLGFYEGEMSGGYTEKLKTALKCFQNAYLGGQSYNVENGIPSGLQGTIESVGAAYYTNLTNSKLTDALKKLGFASPSTEEKQNFARIQTFLEKGMGCTKYQVAGIMGNIKHESCFSSKTVNSGSGAFGIIQWNGNRKTYLNKYAAENGYSSADNMGIQLAFFRYEMTRTWGKGDIAENAPNSELVESWNKLKSEYKYSFYDVSDFFKDHIEGCKDGTYQIRENYSSIIYQAIS